MYSDSIEDNWEVFKQLMNDAAVQFVPTSTPKASKSPPWWTKSISVAIKAKHSAFSRLVSIWFYLGYLEIMSYSLEFLWI